MGILVLKQKEKNNGQKGKAGRQRSENPSPPEGNAGGRFQEIPDTSSFIDSESANGDCLLSRHRGQSGPGC